jgi:hypothetical protein
MEMLEMRVLIAAILFAVGIAGVRAADLSIDQPANYSARSFGIGDRTGMLVVYDYEPGVNVRPYWLAPWRHRHYYPRTGEQPEIGRDENLSAPSGRQKPAETFRRSWSNSSVFSSELPRMRARPLDAVPAPPQNPAPLK